MNPSSWFRFCPSCGTPGTAGLVRTVFHCDGCGFHYYFNPAVSVAVFIQREDGRVLMIRRAREPGRGLLAPPGGFVDLGETAEAAVIREVREEVGLPLTGIRFLCSSTNDYPYRGITYPVVDLFFTAVSPDPSSAAALEDVSELEWLEPGAVDSRCLAFPSMKTAWAAFLAGREQPPRP